MHPILSSSTPAKACALGWTAFPGWVAAVVLSCLFVGCRPAELPPSPEVVAEVGTEVITTVELEAELQRRARGGISGIPQSARQAALEDMIRHRVFLRRAREAGYEERPEIRRRMERLVIAQYEEDHAPERQAVAAPTSDEVEQAYRARIAEFTEPERLRISVMVLQSSPKASVERRQAVREKLEGFRRQIESGGVDAFAEVARLHSEDRATRHRGGESGWIRRDAAGRERGWPEAVLEAALALAEPGELSPVVETPEAFYLVRLGERRAASPRPLAEVEERIVHTLRKDREELARREFEARQREGLAIRVHEAALERVPIPTLELTRAASPPPSPAR
jgi:parvulin-like peptidyl-prolyl isomerase